MMIYYTNLVITGTSEKREISSLHFFLTNTEVKTRRVLTTGKGIFSSKGFRESQCGKRDRFEFEKKEDAVEEFISKLCVNESYCGRAKTKRLYLTSELNVTKLHKIYNTTAGDQLK